MRYNTIAGAVLTAASAVVGKELPKDDALAAGMFPALFVKSTRVFLTGEQSSMIMASFMSALCLKSLSSGRARQLLVC